MYWWEQPDRASSDQTLAIIPAGEGSKRVPCKKGRCSAGVPLIGYTIRAAFGSSFIQGVIVATNDAEIAQVSGKFGAVVLWRPTELNAFCGENQRLLNAYGEDRSRNEADLQPVEVRSELSFTTFPEINSAYDCDTKKRQHISYANTGEVA